METDRKRKVRVVFVLYAISLCIVLACYFSNTDFAEIEKMIIKAMQVETGEEAEDYLD